MKCNYSSVALLQLLYIFCSCWKYCNILQIHKTACVFVYWMRAERDKEQCFQNNRLAGKLSPETNGLYRQVCGIYVKTLSISLRDKLHLCPFIQYYIFSVVRLKGCRERGYHCIYWILIGKLYHILSSQKSEIDVMSWLRWIYWIEWKYQPKCCAMSRERETGREREGWKEAGKLLEMIIKMHFIAEDFSFNKNGFRKRK